MSLDTLTFAAPVATPVQAVQYATSDGILVQACAEVSPDMMFPEGSDRTDLAVVAALKVCSSCYFRLACARWAVDTGQTHGVWGGLTERDRQTIARRRRRTAQAAREDAQIAQVG